MWPVGLGCLHCSRGLHGPGRAHPPAGSRVTAAARRGKEGGGAGCSRCRLAARGGGTGSRESSRNFKAAAARDGAPRSLGRLRPVAPSAPQKRPRHLHQPPPREQPPPPSAPHGPLHRRPEAAPRGFSFPRRSVSPSPPSP